MVLPAPLIAINGFSEDDDRVGLRLRYARAVLRAGGVPVVLAPVGDREDVERVLDRVDGLLLTGGDDFQMELLGTETTHPEAVRTIAYKQRYDQALAAAALERGLPTLGICYGMQLLGLVEGASLYQHLPEDRPDGREHRGRVLHAVHIQPGTKLASILGVNSLETVSQHHQALAAAGGGWSVSASDDEGLIEAIEKDAHPFALGVQWHPELSPAGGPQDLLFGALISAARARATRPAATTTV